MAVWKYGAFSYKLILILYYTNVKYDNMLDKYEFGGSGAKVKVTVAIFRKNIFIVLTPSFMYRVCYNFTQRFSMGKYLDQIQVSAL